MKYSELISIETKYPLKEVTLRSNRKTSKYSLRKVVFNWDMPKANKFDNPYGSTTTQPNHCSIEKFALFRLKMIQYYLLDTLETKNLERYEREWFTLNYKRVTILLNGGAGSKSFFCTPTHLYIIMKYKQIRRNIIVGRLYPERIFSYVYFPREIRGLLITNEYKDFDIVNAHPTLLLEYVLTHMPDFKPNILTQYVKNRDALLKVKSEKDGTSAKEAKRQLLMVLNCQRSYVPDLGHYGQELYDEVEFLRNDLFQRYYTRDSSIYRYYSQNSNFHRKKLEEQKVSVQSIYLQSRETDYVFDLIKFLRDKTQNYLEKLPNVKGFDNLTIDRETSIDAVNYYISCIPFYDGLYIGSEDGVTNMNLGNLVNDYNKLLKDRGSLVRFEEKSINEEEKRLHSGLFTRYIEVFSFLNSLSPVQLHKLLIILEMNPIDFSEEYEISGLARVSREFRRTLMKRLLQVVEKHELVFTVDLYDDLTELYRETLKKHKQKITHYDDDSEESYDLTLENFHFDSSDDLDT